MFKPKDSYDIHDLTEIVAELRNPETGCPWDKVQTHASIRKGMLEEAYEVADAIDLNDAHLMCEELGDVLLQVVFHAQIEAEQNSFNFNDVCDGICKKLVLRHPHVFGTVEADTPEKVLDNWDKIKNAEKGRATATKDLDDVPNALPALMRAQKLQKRAAGYGYDFPDAQSTIDALEAEIAELREAVAANDKAAAQDEMGDVLFSAVNVARHLKADSEESLTQSANKFAARVKAAEAIAQKDGKQLTDLTPAQLDELWQKAKVCTKQ